MLIMDKVGNILLIVNPISGDSDKKNLLEEVKARLPEKAHMEIYTTSGKKDLKKISKMIQKTDPDRILVAGGDGTIRLVAEALGDKNPIVGILPAGSANGLASDLNLPLDAKDFIPVALGETTKEFDAIRVNDELSLHISDFGLNAELIKEYEKSNFRGKFSYLINSISALYNSNMPYSFTIEANGKTSHHKAIMVAIANSRKYGTGALVNPKGKTDDGKFEILVFKKFDILEILKTLQGEIGMSADFVETIVATNATISTEIPIDFQIDGEYCNALKKVTASIVPKKLRLAVK